MEGTPELLRFPSREAGGRNQPLRGALAPRRDLLPQHTARRGEAKTKSPRRAHLGTWDGSSWGLMPSPQVGRGWMGRFRSVPPLDRSEGTFGKGKGGRLKPSSESSHGQQQKRSRPRQVTKTPRQSRRQSGASVGNADLQTPCH